MSGRLKGIVLSVSMLRLLLLFLLLLLLLYDMNVSCHRPFLPGSSLETSVIPTASSFTPQSRKCVIPVVCVKLGKGM